MSLITSRTSRAHHFRLIPHHVHYQAEHTDEGCCYMLAQAYSDGAGVERNHGKAFELWKRSARMGHGPSCTALAKAAMDGRGTVRDESDALKWFLKAKRLYVREPVRLVHLNSPSRPPAGSPTRLTSLAVPSSRTTSQLAA